MRKVIVVVALAAVALLGSAPRAHADTYPSVSGIKAFSEAANFMSLPGYLRYRVLLEQGRWLTRQEAQDAVNSQGGAAAQ